MARVPNNDSTKSDQDFRFGVSEFTNTRFLYADSEDWSEGVRLWAGGGGGDHRLI